MRGVVSVCLGLVLVGAACGQQRPFRDYRFENDVTGPQTSPLSSWKTIDAEKPGPPSSVYWAPHGIQSKTVHSRPWRAPFGTPQVLRAADCDQGSVTASWKTTGMVHVARGPKKDCPPDVRPPPPPTYPPPPTRPPPPPTKPPGETDDDDDDDDDDHEKKWKWKKKKKKRRAGSRNSRFEEHKRKVEERRRKKAEKKRKQRERREKWKRRGSSDDDDD